MNENIEKIAKESFIKSVGNIFKTMIKNPKTTAAIGIGGLGASHLIGKYGLPIYYVTAERKKKKHNKLNEYLLRDIAENNKLTNEILKRSLNNNEPKMKTYNQLMTY